MKLQIFLDSLWLCGKGVMDYSLLVGVKRRRIPTTEEEAPTTPPPTAAGTFIDNQAGEILAAVTADQLHTHLRYGLQDASLPEPAKAELTQRVDLTKGVPVDLNLTGIDPGTYDVYFYLVSDATTKESALEGELDLVVT